MEIYFKNHKYLGVCDVEQSHRTESDINEQTSKPFSDLLQAPPPPPPFMNRKMRRRGFHDPPRTPEPPVQNVAEVGVIDIDDQVRKLPSFNWIFLLYLYILCKFLLSDFRDQILAIFTVTLQTL